MDRTASRFDAETLALSSTSATTLAPTAIKASRRKSKRANVRPMMTDAGRRAEFDAFAASLRDELAPSGLLESIYADRAVAAAWRLKEAAEAERAGLLGGMGLDTPSLLGRLADDARREADRAEKALRRALDALADIRGKTEGRWGVAARLDTTVPPIDLVEDAPLPPVDLPADESDDAPLPRWQDRLTFDLNVSDDSPVVKGTWVTASQIVTLIVDGLTWADILRSYPELTEEDIRVCLAYVMDQDAGDSRGEFIL